MTQKWNRNESHQEQRLACGSLSRNAAAQCKLIIALVVQRKGEQSALSNTSGQGMERHDEEMTQMTSKSSAEDVGADHLEDTGDGGQERVQRRLAQNREAARKSRQRRKKYITDLEAEVCKCISSSWLDIVQRRLCIPIRLCLCCQGDVPGFSKRCLLQQMSVALSLSMHQLPRAHIIEMA